jgi:hypothetical protein
MSSDKRDAISGYKRDVISGDKCDVISGLLEVWHYGSDTLDAFVRYVVRLWNEYDDGSMFQLT